MHSKKTLFTILPLLETMKTNNHTNFSNSENTHGYGLPIEVIIYALVGIGIILIYNLLLEFKVIKALPLSEEKIIKLFFTGIIIVYIIALYLS